MGLSVRIRFSHSYYEICSFARQNDAAQIDLDHILVKENLMNALFATSPYSMGSPKMKDDYFSSISRKIGTWAVHLVDVLLDRLEHSREHAALARMDCRELQDIGLTRSDIDRVMTTKRARKPI